MYDFGSTTDLLITIVGETIKTAQKRGAVRLLARNVPPVFRCKECKKPASLICAECAYDSDNPFLCDSCAEKHEHEYLLPITNSPRMGVCGYEGELDIFEFKAGDK